MIKTVYEQGYCWIEIPDELWNNAEFMDYDHGYPIYARRMK